MYLSALQAVIHLFTCIYACLTSWKTVAKLTKYKCYPNKLSIDSSVLRAGIFFLHFHFNFFPLLGDSIPFMFQNNVYSSQKADIGDI